MLREESNLRMTSVPLDDWLEKNEAASTSVWNHTWTRLLHQGNKEELEEYLSSFCYSILDLSEEHQVLVARTVFISMITHILKLQRRKNLLQPALLKEAYAYIFEIETWKNISEFLLKIPSFITLLVDRLLRDTPLYNNCSQLHEAIQLINASLTNRKLSVQWVAAQLELSTTHLSNLFRLNVGMNTSDYIAKRRVTEIADDLVHTSKSLAAIREKYGFSSHSHFIQFFKRHKGKTPLKYRQYVLHMTEEAK